MSSDRRAALPGADPDLVHTWITGWTLARQTPPPVRDGAAFRVDVGWPQQQARHVFACLDEEVGRRAGAISEPWVYLKVCASCDAVQAVLPQRWTVQPQSFLMIGPNPAPLAPPVLAPGYTLRRIDGAAPRVEIVAEDGAAAAHGHAATVGAFAVYDQIETDPGHRRRGLGRAVMEALDAMARERGATRGLLVATADGRALYESLGWAVASLYTSAVILAP